MSEPIASTSRRVPARALLLSLAALSVPVSGVFLFPQEAETYQILLWLPALVPAFLLAYYRGWSGAALALALGMAALAGSEVAAIGYNKTVPDWPVLLGLVGAFIVITLGVGWMAHRMNRDRIEAERLSLTDALTGLPNRRHMRVFLDNEFAAAERGRKMAVVIFDVDRFKQYNDQFGHQAGDEALKAVAQVLSDQSRRMDLAARYGGEEFVTVLSDTEESGARKYVERVRRELRSVPLQTPPVTVSAGIAGYREEMKTPDDMLDAADEALYQAKRDGRDCVRVYMWTIPV